MIYALIHHDGFMLHHWIEVISGIFHLQIGETELTNSHHGSPENCACPELHFSAQVLRRNWGQRPRRAKNTSRMHNCSPPIPRSYLAGRKLWGLANLPIFTRSFLYFELTVVFCKGMNMDELHSQGQDQTWIQGLSAWHALLPKDGMGGIIFLSNPGTRCILRYLEPDLTQR